jgi:hypothetical protein
MDTFSREKKALKSGMNVVGIDTALIITNNEKRVEHNGEYTLNMVPIWEWLLLPTEEYLPAGL